MIVDRKCMVVSDDISSKIMKIRDFLFTEISQEKNGELRGWLFVIKRKDLVPKIVSIKDYLLFTSKKIK